jgi:hypothetical protein
MITPQEARQLSNENYWNKLTNFCKTGLERAIKDGRTNIILNYRNKFTPMLNDMKILQRIGYNAEPMEYSMQEVFTDDGGWDVVDTGEKYYIMHEMTKPKAIITKLYISW